MRRTEFFDKSSIRFESSMFADKTNGNLPGQSSFNTSNVRKMSHCFKAPSNLPVRQRQSKNPISPRRKVLNGGIKKDTKVRKTLLPVAGFNCSRRSLHYTKVNNIRKGLVEKVLFLTENALKDGKDINPTTPAKLNAVLTPKTPRSSRSYMVLPEFKKLSARHLSPDDFIVKKGTNSAEKQFSPIKQNSFTQTEAGIEPLEMSLKLNSCDVYKNILRHCRQYNTEVRLIYGKIRMLDDCFESNIKNLPDYDVCEEFLKYEAKKKKLYEEVRNLEKKFKDVIISQTLTGSKLKELIKKRKECFDKRIKLHKEFEEVVNSALEKCQTAEKSEKESVSRKETPKLRRSLRLVYLNHK